MMAKLVGLYSKKGDMSSDAFFSRYEYGHVPLVMEIFSNAFAGYTRSYPRAEPELRALAIRPDALGFDALTQIWFRDEGEAAGAVMAEPGNAERLAEDEAAFLDRRSLLSFSVVERGAAPADADALFKVVALYDRADPISAENFFSYAETILTQGTTDLRGPDDRPLLAGCRRSYLLGLLEHPMYETARQPAPDLILELWMRSPADIRAWLAAIGSDVPASGAIRLRAAAMVSEVGEPAPCKAQS
jgi:hypothetical protein